MSYDDLRVIEEEKKFGYTLGQEVMIVEEGPFFSQIQTVTAFTKKLVIVTVSGPSGEPDSEWWFEPNQIQNINPTDHYNN